MIGGTEAQEFYFDTLFIKFKGLKLPVGVFMTEVFPGELDVPSLMERKEIKINLTDKADVVTFTQDKFKEALESVLRDPKDTAVVDYGVIEEFEIQPREMQMRPEVAAFLQKYNS